MHILLPREIAYSSRYTKQVLCTYFCNVVSLSYQANCQDDRKHHKVSESMSVIQLARFIYYKMSNLVKSSAMWNTIIKTFYNYMDIVLSKALWTENDCLCSNKYFCSWAVYSNVINIPWGGTLIDPQWMALFQNKFVTHQWLSLVKMLGVYVHITDPMNNTSVNMAAYFVRIEIG